MASNEVGSAYVSVKPKVDKGDLSKAENELENGLGKSGSKAGSKFGGGISKGLAGVAGAIGGIFSTIASGALDAVTSSIGDAVHRVDTIQNFPKIMANLGYDSTDAAAAVDKVASSLKGLPTSTDALVGVVQKLAPLTSSLDEATDISLALNNALLAGGKSTEVQSNALEQYSQMLAAGKVDMQAWRSMLDAMPGQLDQLAVALLGAGHNQNDLYNAMKDGTVTFDDFNKKLVELNTDGVGNLASFEEQAKAATGGIETAFTNVQNAITRNIANIIMTLGQDNISGAIGGVSTAIDAIGGGINEAVKGIQGFGNMMAEDLAPSIQTVGENAAGAQQSMADSASALGDAIAPTAQQFSDFANGEGPQYENMMANMAAASDATGPAFDDLGRAFDDLCVALEPVINTLGPALLWLVDGIVSGISWLVPIIIEVVSVIIEVVAQIINVIVGIVTGIASVVMAIVNFFTVDIPNAFNTAVGAVVGFFTGIGEFFANLPGTIAGAVETLVSTVAGFVGSMVGAGVNLITGLWDGITSFIGNIANTVSTGVQDAVNAVSGFFTDMFNAGWDIIQGLIDGISGAIGGVVDAVTGGVQNAIDTAKGMLGIASPSKLFRYFGDMTMQGFAKGIEESASMARSAMEGAVTDVYGTAHVAVDAGGGSLSALRAPVFEPAAGGRVTNVYIDGNLARISRIAEQTLDDFLDEISRYGTMQGAMA